MRVTELNKGQLHELKTVYLFDIKCHDESIDWYDLANVNDIVSDDEVFKYYNDVEFTNDDFLFSREMKTC